MFSSSDSVRLFLEYFQSQRRKDLLKDFLFVQIIIVAFCILFILPPYLRGVPPPWALAISFGFVFEFFFLLLFRSALNQFRMITQNIELNQCLLIPHLEESDNEYGYVHIEPEASWWKRLIHWIYWGRSNQRTTYTHLPDSYPMILLCKNGILWELSNRCLGFFEKEVHLSKQEQDHPCIRIEFSTEYSFSVLYFNSNGERDQAFNFLKEIVPNCKVDAEEDLILSPLPLEVEESK